MTQIHPISRFETWPTAATQHGARHPPKAATRRGPHVARRGSGFPWRRSGYSRDGTRFPQHSPAAAAAVPLSRRWRKAVSYAKPPATQSLRRREAVGDKKRPGTRGPWPACRSIGRWISRAWPPARSRAAAHLCRSAAAGRCAGPGPPSFPSTAPPSRQCVTPRTTR